MNDWRAFTAELLSKLGPNEQQMTNVYDFARVHAKDIMDLMAPWGDPKAISENYDALVAIFVDATKLAQFLRRQRACWSVRFPTTPGGTSDPAYNSLRFDSSCMKDDTLDEEDEHRLQGRQHYVELVVTPGLGKRGDEHGEHFESENCVSKASVIIWKDW